MAQAKDYPISFGYGATDDTYYGPKAQGKPTYIGPYHKGDDRAMPSGTPVIVNGVQIGLSGSGNGRYGAHLHIGRFVNGVDTNPNGGGFSLNGARVVTVVDNYATDPVNAKYVRIQDSSGAQWVYLHMSQVNVLAGQELNSQGGNEVTEAEFSAELNKRDKRMDADEANVSRLYKTVDDDVQNLARLYQTVARIDKSVDEINKQLALLAKK